MEGGAAGIEAGSPGSGVGSWAGLLAPAKTPNQEISKIAGYVTAALREPEIQSKLNVMNSTSVESCGADFAAYIRKEYEETGRIIRESNIKPQ